MRSDKVFFKCINLGSIDNYKYNIIVYDINNKIICKGVTKDNIYYFNCKKGYYKALIYNNYLGHKYISFNTNNRIIIVYFNMFKKITLHFTDKNYIGLPIEKGRIDLWQNHIQ